MCQNSYLITRFYIKQNTNSSVNTENITIISEFYLTKVFSTKILLMCYNE